MEQPPPVQWRQRAPDNFWISGLLILGATQQTVHSPQSRPGIKVMPSHMILSLARPGRRAPP
jgi:hypothetical protein